MSETAAPLSRKTGVSSARSPFYNITAAVGWTSAW